MVFPHTVRNCGCLGTFLDDVYLSKLMSPEEALISYELTFLFCGILSLFYLVVIKKEKFMILRERIRPWLQYSKLRGNSSMFMPEYQLRCHCTHDCLL